jgi:hypothetical protein
LQAANISILDPVDKAEDGLEELAEDAVMAEATAEPDATSTESEAMVESDEDTPPSPVSNAPANNDEERFIEGRVRIRNVGDLERGGSTLFYLYQEGSRNILIILSDNSDTNADAFDLLLDRKLLECQATSQIAVCQTEDPNEDLPPSLRSNRIAKILIVSDDDGHEREDAQTGALEFSDAFSQTTYVTDIWTTSDDGDLDIDTLLEYDAIIWATGDYWDDSIGQEDVELLTEYVTVGGNLIMSGASIGFDWDHTDFLTSVAHADYLDFAQQTDMVVSQADHPIATDFDEDTVIEFLETPSGEELLSDVVNYTEDARVIFRRGPDSEADDAPAVIAYEDDRVKIAYYAFPLYLLPSTERTLLVNNTVDWFTKKVLDLPTARDYEPYETDGITRPAPSDEENQDEDTGGGDEAPADGDENGGEGDNEGEGDNQEGENGDEGNNDEGDNTEDQGEDGNNDQGDGGGDEGENNDGGTN